MIFSLSNNFICKNVVINKFNVDNAYILIYITFVNDAIVIEETNLFTVTEHVALTYFENVAKGDWNKVYDYFDLPESQFVSRSMFKKAMKDTDKIECSNYQVKINNSVEEIILLKQGFNSGKDLSSSLVNKTANLLLSLINCSLVLQSDFNE